MYCSLGFAGGSDGKEFACNAGDKGLIFGSGRFPGRGHGYLLQYSCLENPTDRGAWRVAVHGVTKELDMTKAISSTLCDHVREKKNLNKNSSQRKQKRRLKQDK